MLTGFIHEIIFVLREGSKEGKPIFKKFSTQIRGKTCRRRSILTSMLEKGRVTEGKYED